MRRTCVDAVIPVYPRAHTLLAAKEWLARRAPSNMERTNELQTKHAERKR
jgi:hypothetical protein